MKFALTARQSKQYLEKADEILVDFRDRKAIPEFSELYPEKTIILIQYANDELDMSEIATFKILTHEHLIICLSNLKYVPELKKMEVPWYWGFPINSYFELGAIKEMGACYVKLGAPLFFDLPTVKKFEIPIRAIPNVAYDDGLERLDGVCGTWIRPEDMDAYDEYIDAVEFADCDQRKEQALYRIYAEDKSWPTDLGLLITNLNHMGVNRLINPEDSQHRISCRQDCQENHICHICYRMLSIANPDLIKSYMEGQTGSDWHGMTREL